MTVCGSTPESIRCLTPERRRSWTMRPGTPIGACLRPELAEIADAPAVPVEDERAVETAGLEAALDDRRQRGRDREQPGRPRRPTVGGPGWGDVQRRGVPPLWRKLAPRVGLPTPRARPNLC